MSKNNPVSSLLLLLSSQDCGADCAKFQKSELEYKFSKRALERPYNSKHSWGKTYGDHKRHLEFSHDQYRELKNYATEIGIFLTASGMDEVTYLIHIVQKSSRSTLIRDIFPHTVFFKNQ